MILKIMIEKPKVYLLLKQIYIGYSLWDGHFQYPYQFIYTTDGISKDGINEFNNQAYIELK